MMFHMQAVMWLVVLVILLAVEAITLGLTTIWFAGGALAAFAMALLGFELIPQLAAFCILSVILLLFTRPAAVRLLNRDRVRTNAESLVGMSAVVTAQIDNLRGTGEVQIRGQIWSARSSDEQTVIPEGRQVIIQSISGVKLIVKEEK